VLDLARYADTNGGSTALDLAVSGLGDPGPNADLLFDHSPSTSSSVTFSRATLHQRIATGPHRNTMLNEKGHRSAEIPLGAHGIGGDHGNVC
jgi:hypothetical protein